MSGGVFLVQHDYQADYKVFFCDHDYQERNAQLLQNCHLVDHDYQAQVKIFIVQHDYQANILITRQHFPR
jgi:hypothetical protein